MIAGDGEPALGNSEALHAPEVEYRPPPDARKRGAVIGSAPKLNPEGIQAAAREAQAKEELQRRKVLLLYLIADTLLGFPLCLLLPLKRFSGSLWSPGICGNSKTPS